MHTLLFNAIMVVGFCLATVGAAGFGKEKVETLGPWLFGVGVVLMFVSWFLQRRGKAKGGGAHEADGGLVGRSKRLIGEICAKVVELDEKKGELTSDEMRRRIDELLSGEYFDLTSNNEELAKLIGFKSYAAVWEGVATAERQLARVWSMATDGYLEEGLESLPLARANLEHAQQAAAEI